MTTIDDYRRVAAPGAVDFILRLAEQVQGRRFLHVTGGRFGGGAAEALRAAVPMLAELGVDTCWEMTGGDPASTRRRGALQAALEGGERVLSDEGLEHWVDMNGLNAKKLRLDADVTVVHDCQPARRREPPGQGPVGLALPLRLRVGAAAAVGVPPAFADQYDAAVFSLPGFERRLGIPMYIVPPSIDPLSEHNRDLRRAR